MNTTASTAGCYFVTTVAGVPTTPETKRGSSVFVLISGLTIIASATNPAFAQTTISGADQGNGSPHHSGTPRAVRANDFLNSIGVGTHMSQGADDPSQVASSGRDQLCKTREGWGVYFRSNCGIEQSGLRFRIVFHHSARARSARGRMPRRRLARRQASHTFPAITPNNRK